jgi:hypothetical protein
MLSNLTERTPHYIEQLVSSSLFMRRRRDMFKSLKNKKWYLYAGLLIAATLCAVDFKLIDGMPFHLAQIASSSAAVALKLAALFGRN